MEANVQLKLGAYPMAINEKGEPELGDAQARKVELTNEEIEKMVVSAKDFNELYDNFRGSGIYLAMEDSKVVIMPVNGGTVIFFNDGPLQDKLTIDKEITPDVALQIQNAQSRDNLEKILVQNNVIERADKEMDREVSIEDEISDIYNTKDIDLERNQESAIAKNRYERDINPERKVREMEGFDR